MSQDNSFTEQQRLAIDARNVSVVLSSGAGCGKTHVLTARYLSHLERDQAGPGEIVAITFTDRAAREMRSRIRAAIAEHAQSRKGAGADWSRHLRELETAPISTIHSFCAILLRQHAVAAGLDPRFEVLEEVLAANLRAEAIRSELQTLLLSDEEAGVALRELVVRYGWVTTVQAVEQLILDYDAAAWDRFLGTPAASIAADWAGRERNTLRQPWIDYLTRAYAPVAHCLNLLRSTPCLGPETRRNVARILEATPALATASNLDELIDELHECAKVGRERGKAWPDEPTYATVRDSFEDFRKKLREKMNLFLEEPEDLHLAVETGQRFIRVAREVAAGYQNRKRRAGAVDFQDLLVLARDLLRDHADVREVLQQRYRFVLLDELQDTDPIQMELVELLCGSREEDSGKLFAVGDHKQSIYRFRGADVTLFEALRETVAAPGRLSLNTNFRSQRPLLGFVNALFAKQFARYEPLVADHPASSTKPCTEFFWAAPAAGESKSFVNEARQREADAIAARIVELIQDETPRIYEKETGILRRVQTGDVALLFRSMSHVGTYEAALRRQGLDYYLVGGRAFFAQQEVYDILSLLRCLENPDDAVSLAGTLRSPFCCLSDEALLILGLHPAGLWAGLHDERCFHKLAADQRARVERARKFLGRWRESKDRLPIARLLNQVLADSGYDAALQFEFLGDRKLANLWKLVDMARSFDRSGIFGLADFIRQLGEQVERQPREEQAATQPENASVIRLMSIHQSKGLEFPVVFVVDVAAAGRGEHFPVARWHRKLGCLVQPPQDEKDAPPFPDFGSRLGAAWDTLDDWAEDQRILYVACTRARDLLILSAGLCEALPTDSAPHRPVPFKGANSWMTTLGERFQLRTGECLAGDIATHERPRVSVRIVQGDAKPEANAPARPVRANVSEPADADTPPRVRGRPSFWRDTVVSLQALEWHLRYREADDGEDLFGTPSSGQLPLDRLVESFTTESRAERHSWQNARTRIAQNFDLPGARREALLHWVMERWDLRDYDGWEDLLVKGAEALETEVRIAGLARDVGPLLRTFAQSDVRKDLLAASACYRQVEFLVDLQAALGDLVGTNEDESTSLPYFTGWIDFLWRDAGDVWHVLALEAGQSRFRPKPWYGRKPFLELQAWAASQQLGQKIATISLLDLSTGKLEEAPTSDPRRGKALAPVRHAFLQFLARARR